MKVFCKLVLRAVVFRALFLLFASQKTRSADRTSAANNTEIGNNSIFSVLHSKKLNTHKFLLILQDSYKLISQNIAANIDFDDYDVTVVYL